MERRGKERGESKGKKKFERRKKNSRRLALSRDVALILCPLLPTLSRIGYAQRRSPTAFFARDVRNILPSLCLQTTQCVSSLCIIFPLIKEHG